MTAPWWLVTYLNQKYLALARPYIRGAVLDIGCGEKKYADLFKIERYISVELAVKFRPDIIANGEALPFSSETFDSILSTQVLEHVRDLDKFMLEVIRVLKQGGYFVITVPFIGRLHNIPNDYLRFSEFGIRNIFNKYGLSSIMVKPMGGFFTTQCCLWIFFFYETVQSIKIRSLRIAAHKLLGIFLLFFNCLSYLLHQIDREGLTPFNYLAVAIKSKEFAME